jgi:hypothetical protein
MSDLFDAAYMMKIMAAAQKGYFGDKKKSPEEIEELVSQTVAEHDFGRGEIVMHAFVADGTKPPLIEHLLASAMADALHAQERCAREVDTLAPAEITSLLHQARFFYWVVDRLNEYVHAFEEAIEENGAPEQMEDFPEEGAEVFVPIDPDEDDNEVVDDNYNEE